jgi:hypothetical protein
MKSKSLEISLYNYKSYSNIIFRPPGYDLYTECVLGYNLSEFIISFYSKSDKFYFFYHISDIGIIKRNIDVGGS